MLGLKGVTHVSNGTNTDSRPDRNVWNRWSTHSRMTPRLAGSGSTQVLSPVDTWDRGVM